jgi:hypothetical protein
MIKGSFGSAFLPAFVLKKAKSKEAVFYSTILKALCEVFFVGCGLDLLVPI